MTLNVLFYSGSRRVSLLRRSRTGGRRGSEYCQIAWKQKGPYGFFYSFSSSYLKLASFTGCHSTGLPISHPLPLPLTLDVQNHGLLVATNTIESTVHFYIALEKSCQVQLMAEAAATSKGSHPIKVEHDDAIHTWKTVGSPMAGWFSGLPQFQSLERREGVRFAFSKNVQLPAISARL